MDVILVTQIETVAVWLFEILGRLLTATQNLASRVRQVFAPVARHDKNVVIVLNALVPVIFCFKQIKRHGDIPAFDVAIIVERHGSEHTQAFGDNTNDGIGGRMFWAFSENRIDTRDLEEWKPDTEEQAIALDEFLPLLTYSDKLERHEVTGWEAGAREAYVAIQLGADDYPGAMYGLKKTVLAIALVNLHKTITMDDLRAAEAYIRHQARIRRVFQASQADDGVQAKFNELVIRAVRREDQKMAKKGVAVKDRWINVRRLAQRNEWALRESRLGLQKTVEALHVAGYISLNSEGDWQRPRAAHVVGADCWCGETHEK